MAFEKRNHIKVFVSSTVYDFEPQLDVVYSMKIPVNNVPYSVTKGNKERPNRVVHSVCIKMYNTAVQNNVFPMTSRKGNWVQEYKNQQDILMHLEAQFKNPERVRALMENDG